jgi:hypothetical protein
MTGKDIGNREPANHFENTGLVHAAPRLAIESWNTIVKGSPLPSGADVD